MNKAEIFTIKLPEVFNLGLSLDCGQAFRWNRQADGYFCGVIGERAYFLKQEDNTLYIKNGTKSDSDVLTTYFDLRRDYRTLTESFTSDSNLAEAVNEFNGIRILKQDEWETLCSFIISQNNNIPRIKGIVERLCENFGNKTDDGFYTFPTAETLAGFTVEDLLPLRSGFRAKYIIDAAKKVSAGDVKFDLIKNGTLEQGRDELVKIKGVGDKVAACTLLYGFAKMDAFPMDVWVKRIMAEMYPDGLPLCVKGNEGIAQQYLFHWRRNSKRFIK